MKHLFRVSITWWIYTCILSCDKGFKPKHDSVPWMWRYLDRKGFQSVQSREVVQLPGDLKVPGSYPGWGILQLWRPTYEYIFIQMSTKRCWHGINIYSFIDSKKILNGNLICLLLEQLIFKLKKCKIMSSLWIEIAPLPAAREK